MQHARRNIANGERAGDELGSILRSIEAVKEHPGFVARLLGDELAHELAGEGNDVGRTFLDVFEQGIDRRGLRFGQFRGRQYLGFARFHRRRSVAHHVGAVVQHLAAGGAAHDPLDLAPILAFGHLLAVATRDQALVDDRKAGHRAGAA